MSASIKSSASKVDGGDQKAIMDILSEAELAPTGLSS